VQNQTTFTIYGYWLDYNVIGHYKRKNYARNCVIRTAKVQQHNITIFTTIQ